MRHNLLRLALSLSAAITLGACGGPGGGEDGGGVAGEYGVSHTGSKRSHHVGEDCLNCHKSGGIGDGVFTVAGTVYNGSTPASGGTVYFYTSNSRTSLITTLEVDAYGNFYTIAPIAQLINTGGGVAGLYVNVNSSAMPGVVSNGSCNECHSPAGGVARI